jgi:hypothetical protein
VFPSHLAVLPPVTTIMYHSISPFHRHGCRQMARQCHETLCKKILARFPALLKANKRPTKQNTSNEEKFAGKSP